MEERFYVGGTIFFIDPEDNGAKYHFYDEVGNELTDVKVGDKPYEYSVEGKPTKDRFYVFHDEPIGIYCFGNYGKLLGTKTGFGAGKENTKLLLAGEQKPMSIGKGITLMNQARVANCDDWFVPSKDELQKLIDSRFAKDIFDDEWVWSSSEYSAQIAWLWYSNGRVWYDNYKRTTLALVGVRAF